MSHRATSGYLAVRFWSLLFPILFGVGCNSGDSDYPPTYPVTGVVTYKDSPVQGATVTFHREGAKESALGLTDEKGIYSLSMFNPSDGAMAGQYKVSIAKYDPTTVTTVNAAPEGQLAPGDIDAANYAPPPVAGAAARAAAGGPKNALPTIYANPETSTLKANVSDKGENKFDFKLK